LIFLPFPKRKNHPASFIFFFSLFYKQKSQKKNALILFFVAKKAFFIFTKKHVTKEKQFMSKLSRPSRDSTLLKAAAAAVMTKPPSLSMAEVNAIDEDSVTDKTIKALLQKEIDLQVEIKAVQKEIDVLEKGLKPKNVEDDEDQGNILIQRSIAIF
jgi:hypothetical protein